MATPQEPKTETQLFHPWSRNDDKPKVWSVQKVSAQRGKERQEKPERKRRKKGLEKNAMPVQKPRPRKGVIGAIERTQTTKLVLGGPPKEQHTENRRTGPSDADDKSGA